MLEAGLPSDAVHPFYSGFFVCAPVSITACRTSRAER